MRSRWNLLLLLLPFTNQLPGQPGATAGTGRITFASLLAELTDLDRLWLAPPRAGSACVQFSSYDPKARAARGVQGSWPGDRDGWYANHDRGHYLRLEERAGGREYVLMDAKGPGAVVRIWSANPTGTLRFYVDGAEEPTWSVDFKALTSGRVEPFAPPFGAVRGKGYNLYAPIPFARSLKISCTKGDHHYQVNVRRFPPGTRVESFAPVLLGRHRLDIAEAGRRLLRGPVPRGGRVLTRGKTLEMTGDFMNPADWARLTLPVAGPGVIRELAVKVTPMDGSGPDLANLMRRILVTVTCRGHRLVQVPVGDFFGAAPAFRPYRTYVMEVDARGWGICRFPMPLAAAGRVELVADAPIPRTRLELRVLLEERPVPADALTFRASWHIRKGLRTRPFSEYRVLNARGTGRLVGCFLAVANPTPNWWGEGDEKIFVDGEAFPSTFGTGTEDYFGYAWADPKPFAGPFHAQPQCDGPENFGYTCLNRFHLIDAIPFRCSLLFDLEVWHWRDVYMDYASTAFWYGRPDARSGLPRIDRDPRRRRVEKIEPMPVLRIPGAHEGEGLRVRPGHRGKAGPDLVGWWNEGPWAGDRQLLWRGGRPGDRLVLEVPVPAPGRYRVEAVFSRGHDYGRVGVHLGGKPLTGLLDHYAPGPVRPGAPRVLGELDLPQGVVPLVLEHQGRHPEAGRASLVGLDWVRLVPVPRAGGEKRQ